MTPSGSNGATIGKLAMAALFLVLIGSLIALTMQWRRAEDNVSQARRSKDEAKKERDAAEIAISKLRKVLYASDMNQVRAAWEANNINLTLQLLDRHRPRPDEPDQRGFEWYYWQRQCHSELSKVEIPELKRSVAAEGLTTGGAFDRDGKHLAAGVLAKEIGYYDVRLWDVATGKEQLVIPHMGLLSQNSVAMSPDGNYLALLVLLSSPVRKEAKVWDTRGRKEVLSIPLGPADNLLAFSPDGKRLAVAIGEANRNKPQKGHRVKVWDLQNRSELFDKPVSAQARHIVFNENGSRLVVAVVLRDKDLRPISASLRIWDAGTGEEEKKISWTPGTYPVSAAFTPDGTRIVASLSSQDAQRSSTLRAWDAGDGKELFFWERFSEVTPHRVAFRSDGARIAVTSSGYLRGDVRILDVATRQVSLELQNAGGICSALAFSPDGTILAAGEGGIEGPGIARAWNAETGAELFTLAGHSGYVADLAFSPNGQRIASLGRKRYGESRGEMKLWDAGTGQELLSLKNEDRSWSHVLFSTNGRQLMAIGGPTLAELVQVWDATPLPEH